MALLALLGACTHPVAVGWQERDSHGGGEPHASRPTSPSPTRTSPSTDVGHPDSLTAEQLRAALATLGDTAPAGKLALRAARLAHHRGDDAEARALLARTATAADAADVAPAAAALGRELAAPPVSPSTIAVLLPLSGRFAAIGSELRAAVELAPREGTSWLFLDTRGDPDGAAAAVEQAYARGAVGILGPAGTREAIAAARAASLRGLPIALLAPDDGASPAAGVFRLASSPGDEARAVARMALADNFPTVAVFAPRDDVGEEAADAFVAEATALGLAVTAHGTYDPTGGDLEPDLKKFLNLVPATNPRLADHLAHGGKKAWSTFSPDVPYSLLYIPDRYDRAALVAAFLPYYNVELRTTEFPDLRILQRKHGGHMPQVVQLVGGAGWHHPSLPIRGGDAVQGALIVDTWAAEQGADAAQQFAAAFQGRAGRAASSVAAEAYDAATLVAQVRATIAMAPDPRGALRVALAHARLEDGACGPAAIGVDGELVREATVLEVQGSDLVVAP